jgi:hypothetical protein
MADGRTLEANEENVVSFLAQRNWFAVGLRSSNAILIQL